MQIGTLQLSTLFGCWAYLYVHIKTRLASQHGHYNRAIGPTAPAHLTRRALISGSMATTIFLGADTTRTKGAAGPMFSAGSLDEEEAATAEATIFRSIFDGLGIDDVHPTSLSELREGSEIVPDARHPPHQQMTVCYCARSPSALPALLIDRSGVLALLSLSKRRAPTNMHASSRTYSHTHIHTHVRANTHG